MAHLQRYQSSFHSVHCHEKVCAALIIPSRCRLHTLLITNLRIAIAAACEAVLFKDAITETTNCLSIIKMHGCFRKQLSLLAIYISSEVFEGAVWLDE